MIGIMRLPYGSPVSFVMRGTELCYTYDGIARPLHKSLPDAIDEWRRTGWTWHPKCPRRVAP